LVRQSKQGKTTPKTPRRSNGQLPPDIRGSGKKHSGRLDFSVLATRLLQFSQKGVSLSAEIAIFIDVNAGILNQNHKKN